MAKSGLPAKYIRKAGGDLKKAWRLFKGKKRKRKRGGGGGLPAKYIKKAGGDLKKAWRLYKGKGRKRRRKRNGGGGKSPLPSKYIRQAGGDFKKAWRLYKKAKRNYKHYPLQKKYRKGTKVRPRAKSRGVRRGSQVIIELGEQSPFVCHEGVTKVSKRRNPGQFTSRTGRKAALKRWRGKRKKSKRRKSRRKRKRRSRSKRSKNPLTVRKKNMLGDVVGTLTNPETYQHIAVVGLASMGSVALTKFAYQQTVGRFAPGMANTMLGQIAVAGLSMAIGGVVGKYVTKKRNLQKGIMLTSGVLAAASLIRQLVGMVSPRAASYLSGAGALPAPSYVGDYVSPDTGLGDWVSPESGLGMGPMGPHGLGFVPTFNAIPGKASIF